eukprot:TRINITY_DN23575_c0_g1_i1.p1 TRINITY_DN23575_c0_g1~~TRINITY_DN23575_c0_g1_i1.p1  ORF type:complete len:426 (-),score=71.52 TRINITY_DN23575_c0_g1_i1:302-1579(-)
MTTTGEAPVVSEIALLLDQCSPEELNNILQALEGPEAKGEAVAETTVASCKNCGNTGTDFLGRPCSCGQKQNIPSQPAEALVATCRNCGNTGIDFLGQPCSCDYGQNAPSQCPETTTATCKNGQNSPRQPAEATVATCRSCGNTGTDFLGQPCSCGCGQNPPPQPAEATTCRSCGNTGTDFLGQPCSCSCGQKVPSIPAEVRKFEPVRPTAPAPPPGGRRPVPGAKVKRDDPAPPAETSAQSFSMDDVKSLLNQHSALVLDEVRKMLSPREAAAQPPQPTQAASDVVHNPIDESVDLDTLTRILTERDKEATELEGRLADLHETLASKDQRVHDLGTELDSAIREVRHRQLDLEFQQLKLEERVRSNAEMEQAQRMLSARVEEATLNARHAAIDIEMCRSTPRSVRVQGSLPWTLRKNRIGGALT